MNTIIIGIAGGTGSGKTTITEKIKSEFATEVSVLYHDNYYKKIENLSYNERCNLNYDHPNSYDTDLMIEHVKKLKNGEDIECPVYDFTIHNRSEDVLEVKSQAVLVIEGILIFENDELRNLMDVKIFVDTAADVRILRRIKRDVGKRNRTLDSVIEQYLTTVKPMHEIFVEPSKQFCDIIVPEGGHNLVAMDMILHKIRNHIVHK